MRATESGGRESVAANGGPDRLWSRVVAVGLVLLLVGPLVGPLAGGSPPAPSVTRSSISTCTTIDESGVYTLSQDLETTAGACIEIAASDVTLRGDGHTIEGDGEGVAVRTNESEQRNVTVTDLAVSDWSVGLHYRSVDDGTVENVTARDNREGMAIKGSSDLRVTDNLVRANDHQGLRVIDTDDSTVAENVAFENVADGFVLNGSTNNTLRANVANGNGDDAGADGFKIVDGSDQNDVRQNHASNNTANGIGVHNSSRNTVVGNNASFNVGVVNADGIQIRHVDHTVVRDNVANGNVDDGIDLKVVNNSVVARNEASENVNDGIPIARSHHNLVSANVANDNSKDDREITDRMLPDKEVEEAASDGLTLRSHSSNNTLVRNRADGNHGQGIRVWLGARENDLTNNTVTDNGEDGIVVLNSSGNDLSRNDVRGNEKNGIHLNNHATDNELSANRIHDNRLSGVLLYTANDTLVEGNVVTKNGAGPGANGIRIAHTADATLVTNPAYDNEGTNVSVVSSTRVRILESGSVSVSDSDDVTVVHSALLGNAIPTAEDRESDQRDEE